MRTYLAIPAEDADLALTLGAVRDPKVGQYFAPSGVDLAMFHPWLPAEPKAGALATAQRGISLTELLARVGSVIDHAFPRAEWVRIEISSLNDKSGHVYLDAIDRDPAGKELSKSRAIIWRGQANKIGEKFFKATGTRLADGMKVLVLVQPQFKGQYGLSLNITDVDPSFTLGDMEARLKRIREKLEADGDAEKNRNLPAPIDFSNVAVISPEGAAGFGDFQAEADRLVGAGLCSFTYFHAVFQGEKAKDSLKEAFIKAHTTHDIDPFDALVVIRGGGAAADLHWLNEYIVAKMVCRFHTPVFTGIGHERDSTILDEYAHRSFGTPSKVISHIKEVIATRANKALEDWTVICQGAHIRLSTADARIDKQNSDIAAGANKKLDHAAFATSASYTDVMNSALSMLVVASEKANKLRSTAIEGATSRLDVATAKVDHISTIINDRAHVAIDCIDAKAKNNFDAVTLAARRSIDGIEDHLDAYWLGIVENTDAAAKSLSAQADLSFRDIQYFANKAITDSIINAADAFETITLTAERNVDGMAIQINSHWKNILSDISSVTQFLEAESERGFTDVQYFGGKTINAAEDGMKGLMEGILAHGVDPTLRRGFAIVKADGKPVSSRAAASEHQTLEITFKDGSLIMKKQEQ
jgi:exodeoxyribonuclease VII large subunit